MVIGPTAASKEQRIDFSAGIAGWRIEIEGPLVEIGSRSVFDKSRSVYRGSQRGGRRR